ncbi:MAG TPA: hypothetical protein PLZ42_01870 [Methanothrix sp.]|mgnify:CR=1 FL=1|nr:hypothetical protein [Methanothrix sp.]
MVTLENQELIVNGERQNRGNFWDDLLSNSNNGYDTIECRIRYMENNQYKNTPFFGVNCADLYIKYYIKNGRTININDRARGNSGYKDYRYPSCRLNLSLKFSSISTYLKCLDDWPDNQGVFMPTGHKRNMGGDIEMITIIFLISEAARFETVRKAVNNIFDNSSFYEWEKIHPLLNNWGNLRNGNEKYVSNRILEGTDYNEIRRLNLSNCIRDLAALKLIKGQCAALGNKK